MKNVVFGLVAMSVHLSFAQEVPASAGAPRVAVPMSVVGNVVTAGVSSVTSTNASNYRFYIAEDLSLRAGTSANMPTAGGTSVPVSVQGTLSKPSVRAALGRFFVKALPVLSTGKALYDLAEELQHKVENDPVDFSAKFYKMEQSNVCAGSTVNYGLTGYEGITDVTSTKFCVRYSASSTQWIYGWIHKSTVRGWPGTTFTNGFYETATGSAHNYKGDTRDAQAVVKIPVSHSEFLDAVDRKTNYSPSTSALPRAVVDAIKSGSDVQVEPKAITGPASSPVSKVVEASPVAGNDRVRETTRYYDYGPGPKVAIRDVEIVKDVDRGTGVPTPVSTTESQTAQPAQVITCGLPDTPPCKIDETGTPKGEDGVEKRTKELKDAYKPIEDFVKDPSTLGKPFPGMSWTFALPSGCSVIPLGQTFAPYLTSIDVCQFQPMFHQLMSVVWSIGALFGAISLLMKTTFST